MPYIAHYDEPWYPYGYTTKERYPQYDKRYGLTYYARPRLPPAYFTKGYQFYQDAMNSWMRELEQENKDYWDTQSRFNHIKLFKPVQSLGEHRIPVYYSFDEYKKKANKYTLRKRKEILARIKNNRQKAIKKRIELNKKRALQKRKNVLARKLNKY